MTKEELVQECLKMPESFADYPFGPTTAVIKNKAGKMFAFTDRVNPEKIKKNCDPEAPVQDGDIFLNLKCSPDLIEIFRAKYKAVLPGYYSNKNHWNTIIIGKDVPIEEIRKMIELSFDLTGGKKK
jgi:predicted DNA-binding protein (MmcQ/YjbR family)